MFSSYHIAAVEALRPNREVIIRTVQDGLRVGVGVTAPIVTLEGPPELSFQIGQGRDRGIRSKPPYELIRGQVFRPEIQRNVRPEDLTRWTSDGISIREIQLVNRSRVQHL